jgi:uncharacterized protein (TIGR00251 family)
MDASRRATARRKRETPSLPSDDVKKHPLAEALQHGKGGLYLNVHAQPGARRNELRGMHGGALKIAIRQAPQDGKANDAIICLIAKHMHLPRSDIEVASGHASRRKRLFLHGDHDLLRQSLELWLDD